MARVADWRVCEGGSGLLITGLVVRQIRRQQARLKKRAESGDAGKHASKDVVGLNRKFTKSLRHLMRIAFSDRRAVFLLTTQVRLCGWPVGPAGGLDTLP